MVDFDMEGIKSFGFIWILENFAYCALQKVESPSFVVETIEKTKWKLIIYPRDLNDESNISFYLRRDDNSNGPDRIEIEFELAFLGADGLILKSSTVQIQAFKKGDGFGIYSFEKRENVFDKNRSAFLPEGNLTTRCRMRMSNGEVRMDGQCIARTRFAVERRCFSWKTEKFSAFKGSEESLEIKSVSCDKPVFFLNMFVRQDLDKAAETIRIKFLSATGLNMNVTFKSELLETKGNSVDSGQYELWFDSLARTRYITLTLTKDFLIADSQMYLPNDVLTLICECVFSTGSVWKGVEDISYGSPNQAYDALFRNSQPTDAGKGKYLISQAVSDIHNTGLKRDVICMLNDNIQCDVKLFVENEIYPAHWFILSARSPVFRAMFKSDMKEKARDRIDIEDLKPDTIRRLLLYMYSDFLEELQWETASALYTASDKYQILALKDECSAFLKTNLSPMNACELLVLADLHHDKDLKSVVQGFILKHDDDIINSDDWKVLMKTNAYLAAETMLLKFKK